MSDELAEHWESRYRERTRAWSGKANPTLVAVVSELAPGTAIDLACGEGADVLWLASNGWTATGVDISPTAVERGREATGDLPASFVAADLSAWAPDGPVDLVCSSFMHSEIDFPRIAILRKAATWVAPGGHFLMVTHAEAPWWSALAHHDHVHLPSPEQDAADLALDPEL